MFASERIERLIGLLQPARKTRILDVGANPVARPPYADLFEMGAAEVWGFEPQQPAFDALQESKGEGEHYLPFAVGNGKAGTLHVCRQDGFTSLLQGNRQVLDYLNAWHDAMTVEKSIPVTTHRLDDMDDLPEPDLLKIDVQGAEKMIFENGRRKLRAAVAVITEVAFIPLYRNQPLYQDQAACLQKMGFFAHKFMFVKSVPVRTRMMRGLAPRRHASQMVDGDAVFLSGLLTPDRLSDEQLKHMAICADAVFQSYDVALKCLSILSERGAFGARETLPYRRMLPHWTG